MPTSDYGYAVTTHKAQGITVDQALILASSQMTNRELSYVKLSRHRHAAELYVDRQTLAELNRDEQADDVAPLARQMAVSRQNEAALDFER